MNNERERLADKMQKFAASRGNYGIADIDLPDFAKAAALRALAREKIDG